MARFRGYCRNTHGEDEGLFMANTFEECRDKMLSSWGEFLGPLEQAVIRATLRPGDRFEDNDPNTPWTLWVEEVPDGTP